MDILSRIEDHQSSGAPFAACIFPGENEARLFDQWSNGRLYNEQGDEWIITSASDGENLSPQAITTQAEYAEMMAHALKALSEKQFQKVILSTIKHHPRKQQSLRSIFQQLTSSYPTAYRYLMVHPHWGTWAGASPELLLKKKNQQYSTIALAGTIPTAMSTEDSWNKKLIEEQQIVTRGIAQHLQDIGIQEIHISDTHPHNAGPITHLKTDISFYTSVPVDTILLHLHPTAAICGLPRNESMAFYRKCEKHNRRLYTGYFGIKTKDESDTYFVNLRCMQLFDDHYEIFVGGGITADSITKEEWEETENKARVLIEILG